MSDVITIGSATMDVFVECDDASVVSVRQKDKKSEFMSYKYGSKIEITDFSSQVGGGIKQETSSIIRHLVKAEMR